jgi:hypothetical protein
MFVLLSRLLRCKGGYTFREACNELKFRCEASRANDLMDKPVKGKRVKGLVSQPLGGGDQDTDVEQIAASVMGLISSMSKKINDEMQPMIVLLNLFVIHLKFLKIGSQKSRLLIVNLVASLRLRLSRLRPLVRRYPLKLRDQNNDKYSPARMIC